MFKLKSVAYPHLYLSIQTDNLALVKIPFAVINSSWTSQNDGLFSPFTGQPLSNVTIEQTGQIVKICRSDQCLDAYDSSDTVTWWKASDHQNQQWLVESAEPVKPDLTFISNHWSPDSQILQLQHADYNGNFQQRRLKSRIYYLAETFKPTEIAAFVTNIPLIDTNGDQYVILPDGRNISPLTPAKAQQYNLLNYQERRRARKMAFISDSLVFARGGYGSSVILYPQAKSAFIISVAGAQFEFDQLETQDFIVRANPLITQIGGSHSPMSSVSQPANLKPLFPHYYLNGIKPDLAQALTDPLTQPITSSIALLGRAYLVSAIEDIALIMTAFNDVIPTGQSGWLKLIMVGMGFFANLDLTRSIRPQLLPLYIKAIEYVLRTWGHNFTKIKVVELPNFSGFNYQPTWTGPIGQIRTVQTLNRDVLSLDHPEYSGYLIGLVNAGDVFSYKGNEFGYQSVDAMIGNNTDIRYSQVATFNDTLLKDTAYKRVGLPRSDLAQRVT